MGVIRGPHIVRDGLLINLDTASHKSYPGTGTSVYDTSGNGYTLAIDGATYNSTTKTIDFDGTDDYAAFSNPAELNFQPTDSFTLTAVFSLTAIQQFAENAYDTHVTLFGKGSTGNSVGIGLTRNKTTEQLRIYAGSRAVGQITEDHNITADTIYSTTYSYTPTSQKLYVNGKFISSSSTSAGTGGTFENISWKIFYPAAVPGGNGKYAEGSIYIARMYDRELSANEVLQNYSSISTRFE